MMILKLCSLVCLLRSTAAFISVPSFATPVQTCRSPCDARSDPNLSRLLFSSYQTSTDLHDLVQPELKPDFTGTIGGKLPIFRLDILPDYNINPTNRLDELQKWIESNGITDLWVVSHGWLTDPETAIFKNYFPLFGNVTEQLPERWDRKPGVVGVTWNSISEKSAQTVEKILLGEEGVVVTDSELASLIEELKQGMDVDEAEAFDAEINSPPELGDDDVGNLGGNPSDWWRYFTVQTMKQRAAQTGLRTLSRVIRSLPSDRLKINLVGHSFGALLVAAAASSVVVDSLTLVQAAFNKNAFALKPPSAPQGTPGMFRNVKDNVKGEVAITYGGQDVALRIFYSLAAAFLTAIPFWSYRAQWLGWEIPGTETLVPSDEDAIDMQTIRDALGAHGAENIHDLKEWDNLTMYDNTALEDKKFHNLNATSDEIENHYDVWNAHVARLILKTARFL